MSTERATYIITSSLTLSMNPGKQTPTNSPGSPRVTTVFLLGWSISEMLGQRRKGARPSPRSASASSTDAPRMIVSGGSVEKSTDQFLLAAQRIAQLYLELGFESPEIASAPTKSILELPDKLSKWLHGEEKQFYSSHELRELLNQWSLQVWARLEAESLDSAQAFTAGMSLADTYWYLRLPGRRPRKVLSEESWRRLLSKYRLDAERARLKSLEDCLPPYIAAVLRRHLKSWSIGTTVGYRDGQLVRLPGTDQEKPIKAQDESALQRALERQVRNWESLLFGLRDAKSYLHAGDIRLIVLLRWIGLFFGLLVTAVFLLTLALVSAYGLAMGPLPGLVRFLIANQARVSEYLAVVSVLWTVLIAVPVPIVLRAAYQATRSFQQWLDDTLTTRFITYRTYIPWDTYLKKGVEKGKA